MPSAAPFKAIGSVMSASFVPGPVLPSTMRRVSRLTRNDSPCCALAASGKNSSIRCFDSADSMPRSFAPGMCPDACMAASADRTIRCAAARPPLFSATTRATASPNARRPYSGSDVSSALKAFCVAVRTL